MSKVTRREFLKIGGIGLAALTLPDLSGVLQAASGNRPNLLIIHTDEHNFRTLGCYRKTLSDEQAFMWGKESVCDTPNIDWLAENGALAEKFYGATPVCSPSRASFMTGMYPQNTDVVNNNIPMNDKVITFAEVLGKSGYTTGYAGKWHLDGDGKPQWTPKRKFGFADNRFMYNRGHWKKFEITSDGPRVASRKGDKPNYNVDGADEKSFSTDWLADRTVDFLKENGSKPFCYMLSIPDPHGPDTVRAPYNSKYKKMTFSKARTFDKDKTGVPSWARPQRNADTNQSQYYGMIKCIDDNIGKILDYLKKTGLIKNTIIVFTSDHGDLRGEHHRNNKGVPLEASAKVPFIIYYPEKIRKGTLVKPALGTADFMPTILSLMGVKGSGKEEGRDASELFLGKNTAKGVKDITFSRGVGAPSANWIGAFTSRYKLILSPVDDPWLIDIQEDPDELKNFIKDPKYKATVKELAAELISYGKQFNDQRVSVPKIASDLAKLK